MLPQKFIDKVHVRLKNIPLRKDWIRFWKYVDGIHWTGCWNWIGDKSNKKYGYGRLKIGGKTKNSYRWMMEWLYGPLDRWEVIDHLCDNGSCVNFNHLKITSNAENVLRGIGPSAINSRKTHCPQGHPLKGKNLNPAHLLRGKRACYICQLAAYRKYNAKRGDDGSTS